MRARVLRLLCEPGALVADKHAQACGQRRAAVEVLAVQCRRKGGIAPRVEGLYGFHRILHGTHRHAKHTAHRGPERLGAKGVGAAGREDAAIKSRRIQRAQHRAHVAGVLHVFQQNQPVAHRLRRGGRGHGTDRRHALRRFDLRDGRQHVRRHGIARCLRHKCGQSGVSLQPRLVHKQRAHPVGTGREGFPHHMLAIQEERALAGALPRVAQGAGSLYSRIFETGYRFHHMRSGASMPISQSPVRMVSRTARVRRTRASRTPASSSRMRFS